MACRCPEVTITLRVHTVQNLLDLLTHTGEQYADITDSVNFTLTLDTKAEITQALIRGGYGIDLG